MSLPSDGPRREWNVPNLAIECVVQRQELKKAMRQVLFAKYPRKQALAEYVDLNLTPDKLGLVATGVSSEIPAEVTVMGYARVPYLLLKGIVRALGRMNRGLVRLSCQAGQLTIGNLSFRNPGITRRFIGARIADLPVNASPADTIALCFLYGPEELEESGLLPRVMESQAEAARLIDSAALVLRPLEVSRETVSQFVWEHIRRRAETSKQV